MVDRDRRPEFSDGSIVVIGGSGGIGGAVARVLAERGAKVAVTFHGRAPDAARIVDDIRGLGGEAIAVHCDIRVRRSVESAIDGAVEAFGSVRGIVCAHGMPSSRGPIAETDLNSLRDKFETDGIGFVNVMQACLPRMREQRGGSVTAIVSPTIQRYVPGYGMAMSTKAALAGMIRYFAAEEGIHGVRVNAIAPGVIDAGMALRELNGPVREVLERAIAQTPLRRRGLPREVAELLAFLTSSRSSFITGQIINVDGGFSL